MNKTIIEEIRKRPKRDCSGMMTHFPNCQGCVDVYVVTESELADLETSIRQDEREKVLGLLKDEEFPTNYEHPEFQQDYYEVEKRNEFREELRSELRSLHPKKEGK